MFAGFVLVADLNMPGYMQTERGGAEEGRQSKAPMADTRGDSSQLGRL